MSAAVGADCPLFVGVCTSSLKSGHSMGERVAACNVYSDVDVCWRNCMTFSEPGGFLFQQESQSCRPPPPPQRSVPASRLSLTPKACLTTVCHKMTNENKKTNCCLSWKPFKHERLIELIEFWEKI